MICWQCKCELTLVYEAVDYSNKLYHCDVCERWYEMKKDKEKVNSSVPIQFLELDSPPQIPKSM